MISRLVASTMLAGAVALAFPASAEEKAFPATLKAHAILPANTIIAAPEDAADHLKTSGKFTTADRKRAEGIGTVEGKDGVRKTGLSLPFDGQPVQGFSGIKTMEDGSFWSLSDNGFGSKLNSPDAMLMLHNVKFDWDKGTVERVKTVFLSDPDKKAPFPIVMEGAEKRYLTGADFDVESIQPVADGFWVGEEFGPFLLKFDMDGKLTDVFPTFVGETEVLSPDNPKIALPANPSLKLPTYNLKRSGGFEGLAMSKDGSKLYGLLEGPLLSMARRKRPKAARPGCGSSNSTLPTRSGRAAPGSIRWPRVAKPSAISTCWMKPQRWSSSVTTASARRTRPAPIRRSRRPIASMCRRRSSASTRSLSTTAMTARKCARSAISICSPSPTRKTSAVKVDVKAFTICRS